MTASDHFSLQDRLALVTGATRGIGRALALELARRGAHIIAVARNAAALEELDDAIHELAPPASPVARATLVPMDLTDMAAIDALGASIHQRWGKLDIFVANAGILGSISPVSHMEAAVFEEVLRVNVTSQWRLIRSVEPVLRRSDNGRAILLSSSVAHRIRAFWGAYGASKAALEVIARCWAEEMKHTPLKINCVDPGATRTGMRAQAMPGEDPQTLPTPAEIAARIIRLASPHLQETGMLFNVRHNRFVSYHVPD